MGQLPLLLSNQKCQSTPEDKRHLTLTEKRVLSFGLNLIIYLSPLDSSRNGCCSAYTSQLLQYWKTQTDRYGHMNKCAELSPSWSKTLCRQLAAYITTLLAANLFYSQLQDGNLCMKTITSDDCEGSIISINRCTSR